MKKKHAKFGICYELQLPRPWVPGDEPKLFQNALSQIELADRLGYDHAWQVKHRFLEDCSHSSSPESFLAAASQRTRNIGLGILPADHQPSTQAVDVSAAERTHEHRHLPQPDTRSLNRVRQDCTYGRAGHLLLGC
jgi:hypothetical protein